jgi:hypothetical protein
MNTPFIEDFWVRSGFTPNPKQEAAAQTEEQDNGKG